jgi:hypothetical protein
VRKTALSKSKERAFVPKNPDYFGAWFGGYVGVPLQFVKMVKKNFLPKYRYE